MKWIILKVFISCDEILSIFIDETYKLKKKTELAWNRIEILDMYMH